VRPIPHGTVNGYNNYGCRCDECRTAAVAYQLEKRRGVCRECGGTVSNRFVTNICRSCYDLSREALHGTESRYARCHCGLCRAAAARARKRQRRQNEEARLRENTKRSERYYAQKKTA
jgi:hypothetical protein